MVDQIRRGAYRCHCAIVKHWGQLVAAAIVIVLIGVGGQMILGRTQVTTVLAFGGNTDHSSQGFVDQLNSTGRSSGFKVIPVAYNADIAQGQASIDDGVAKGQAAWNENCASGCEVWGFSWGTEVALQLAGKLGLGGGSISIFGGPQPATGIWHHYAVTSGVPPWQVEFWLNAFGKLPTSTIPPAGTKAFFGSRDPYANAAPQCSNPSALFALSLDDHRIFPPGGERIWTDRFGVEIHEWQTGPTVASGADPSPIWQGCPWFDWNRSGDFDGSNGLPGMFPPFPKQPGDALPVPGDVPLPMPGGQGPLANPPALPVGG